MKNKFEIRSSHFHGDRQIGYSYSLESAVRRTMKKCQGGECKCGGNYIATIDGQSPDCKWQEAMQNMEYSLAEKR